MADRAAAREAPAPVRTPTPQPSGVRAAMVRFTLLSLLGLALVTLVTIPLAAWIARSIALLDAEDRTRVFTRTVAAPLLTEATREAPIGSPLELAMENRLDDGTVVHVVIWDRDGRVVWSDDRSLIGSTYPLDAEVEDLFESMGSRSEYSLAMHAGGADGVPVLEVYAAARDADGVPFVLEWYWPTSRLEAAQHETLVRILPLTIGSLILLHILVLPLTLDTARRVDAERARLAQHATAVQIMERRRLSEDLHDGVVQDLSGIGYVLPTVSRELPPGSTGRGLLERVAQVMQQDVRSIRGMIADIKPPTFAGAGFLEALDALADRTRAQGVAADVAIRGDVDALSPGARALAYRIAREGLRNTVRHSQASRALVDLDVDADAVTVRVRDDGVGPAATADVDPDRDHFGLQLLGEALREAGGQLELRAAEGGGAELVASFRPDRA
ncbi:sensor histidine kinase [Nostocoides sp. F2B08]|uniref:sensor histidine kinase n=1 Tax=Nostocoides sp. F2B08 TaxID=2653936 RepID=UPI00186B0CC8|nr:histidine kinase [Tetrasphaera sp. F2B08]